VLGRVLTVSEHGPEHDEIQDWRDSKKTMGDVGTIRAIFTTIDGEQCYAVENEGALDFVCEFVRSKSLPPLGIP
jgi:hypothetical protein